MNKTTLTELILGHLQSELNTIDIDYKVTQDTPEQDAIFESMDLIARNAFKLGLKLGAEVFGK